MHVLYKDTSGNFDIRQSEAIGISESLSTLHNEAKRLNSLRTNEDFHYGEWDFEYRVDTKKVKVF